MEGAAGHIQKLYGHVDDLPLVNGRMNLLSLIGRCHGEDRDYLFVTPAQPHTEAVQMYTASQPQPMVCAVRTEAVYRMYTCTVVSQSRVLCQPLQT